MMAMKTRWSRKSVCDAFIWSTSFECFLKSGKRHYWHIKLWELDRARKCELVVTDGDKNSSSPCWMKIKSFHSNESLVDVFERCATWIIDGLKFLCFRRTFQSFLSEWHEFSLPRLGSGSRMDSEWNKIAFLNVHRQLQLMWKTSEKKILSGEKLVAVDGS